MPYSGPDDPDLPSNVEELPIKKRKKWVATWNSVYKTCMDDDGKKKDCEGKAFRIANGTIEESMMHNRFFFTELTEDALIEGKPFDGMVAGTFTDMLGRKFEFKEEELSEYAENTQAVITATETEGGEIVGLPIDANGHEKDDAAGWIIGAELVEGIIRLTPKWNKLGQELIGESVRRFFSGTIDTIRKVIQGGTLTNWPATRDQESGKILLRPIELAQGIYELEVSMDEEVWKVRSAWNEGEQLRPGTDSWCAEVFDDYVIIERSDGHFKVAYQELEGKIIFDPPEEWVEVQKAWIEAAKEFLQEAAKTFWDSLFSRNQEVAIDKLTDSQTVDEGEKIMTIKLEELSVEDRAELVKEVGAQLVIGGNGGELSEGAGKTIAEMIDAKADEKVALLAEQAREESEIAEFSKDMTSGSDENPVGLPVEAEEFKAFLAMLTPEAREKAKEIFGKIVSSGLVEFEEKGHSRRVKQGTKLEPRLAKILKEFLSADKENTVETWFELNAADVGVMSDYNLAEFVSKEA